MRVFWAGDFANDAKSGLVVRTNGSLLIIRWDDGSEQVVPAFVTKGHGWRVE